MKRLPIYDATAPITCTIEPSEVQERIELFERMRERLVRLDRTEHGVLLHFPSDPDVEADLTLFVDAEKRCCRFWGFALVHDGDDLALRWDAPPAANDIVERLIAFMEGDQSLTAISGLL